MQRTNRPLRVAHRGGAGLAPENTLAAFRHGLGFQPDAVELDLHMSQDGALVVVHDPNLKRLTGTAAEVGEMTLAQLKTLNAAATYTARTTRAVEPQPIPTLEEVLELVKGQAGVQIEIKLGSDGSRYTGIEAKAVETIRATHMQDHVTIISFDFPTLHEITALAPELPTCALISTGYWSRFGLRRNRYATVANALHDQGFRAVGANYTCMTSGLYQALRARHFQVGVWTVNTTASMRKFTDMGVDFITSDRPDLLQRVGK